MSFRLRPALTIIISFLICSLTACGGDPPDREIQQAEAAIAEAQTAGADRFASEEFKAAQQALVHAREAVDERDYRLALNHALDSRERAQNAAAQASASVATARAAADTAISAAVTSLNAANARIQAAEAAHTPARTLRTLRATIADVEAQVQKARTAWEANDFPVATSAAAVASQQLSGMSEDLEAIMPSMRRRK